LVSLGALPAAKSLQPTNLLIAQSAFAQALVYEDQSGVGAVKSLFDLVLS
jgi:hypothetical protein